MPYSHHSHSGQFCKHAKGTLEEVVLEAIRQRFEVYGLTEHVPRYRVEDLYPEEVRNYIPHDWLLPLFTSYRKEGLALDVLVEQFSNFLEEAHRLKSKYADKIKLLVGLETEYVSPLDLECLEEVLRQHSNRIEYIVGSVHHVNQIPIDFDLPTYERALASFASGGLSHAKQMDAFLSSYFDAQYELMTRIKPEVIGHIDLCRLYEPSLRFIDYPAAYEKLRRNIRFAIDYGAAFELNAAALRKGWKDAYPAEDVLAVGSMDADKVAPLSA